MTATLKVDTIKEVNSSVDNLVLDSSGNVTIGNNLTVNGTTTQTGSTTFTAQTLFPDGSVSAPAISNTGDVNTGVYFPAADNVAIATGGVAALTIDSSQNMTVANTLVMGSSFKRNRIINGDMRVDQRATAVSANLAYAVDRWKLQKSNDATESVAQNSDAPTGFSYSLRNTVSVADTSIGATQFSGLSQFIEGYNIADLAFGTSSAKSVAISFWVRSTVTGQYTGNIRNSDDSRVCPFGYTINSSNTWEFKSFTLPGCIDGTWNTTNGIGLGITWYAALGSTFSGGTAGTWTSTGSIKYGVSSPVNGLNANGNIFAITGVQLEVGSVATPYEQQIYSDQLAQCQRYYEKSFPIATAPAQNNGVYDGTAQQVAVAAGAVTLRFGTVKYLASKRATPNSVTLYNPSAASAQAANFTNAGNCTNTAVNNSGASGFDLNTTTTAGTAVGDRIGVNWASDAEL